MGGNQAIVLDITFHINDVDGEQIFFVCYVDLSVLFLSLLLLLLLLFLFFVFLVLNFNF